MEEKKETEMKNKIFIETLNNNMKNKTSVLE